MRLGPLLVVGVLLGGSAWATEAPDPARTDPSCSDSPAPWVALGIPGRPAGAVTGAGFAERTRSASGAERQEQALEELRRGNVPEFLRTLVPVRLQHRRADGTRIDAVVWVTPDYLSIGSDTDYLRIPLTRPSAVTIAAEFGCVLPTRKMVDAVYDQAVVHLDPRPLQPGPMMRSSEYYARHNDLIETALGDRPPGSLVAGHKKDVVLTDRLLGRERIAIYGWHRDEDSPIQPLSIVHGARYADYSHGIRLVHTTVCVNGRAMSIYDVLADRDLAPVLSQEGWLPRFPQLMKW